jgi:uncharacterized repeat protein (TIGR03803 family)
MGIATQPLTLILRKDLRRTAFVLGLLFALTMFATPTAKAQTYNVIHSFTGSQDGLYPVSGVSVDGHGTVYGTTNIGGSGTSCFEGCGAAFKLTHVGSGWLLTPLYDFVGVNDGGNPAARLIVGPDGSLYGTTSQGGGSGCESGAGCGTVFNLRPPVHFTSHALAGWTETVLYRFTGGSDGDSPRSADLLFDDAGNLYGTTVFGGGGGCQGGCGTVYKLTRSGSNWTESIVHAFTSSGDGQEPWACLIFDQAGSLYGTTAQGGASRYGTAYQLTPSGSGFTEQVLYSFQGTNDGGIPYGGLIFDPAGNLYGTTCCMGSGGGGTVFELTRSQNWAFSVLASFTGNGSNGSLVMDAAGNLYGTTYEGGGFGFGSVFKLTPSEGGWTYTSLHNFCAGGWPCTDGAFPPSGLALDAAGNLYGTTSDGGAYGGGVVFEITP